ncbi:bifunctional riboflavin kinase/FAD synthetase [Paenibacillus sp. 1011MAR3C5]|uniref:bifunctional riboflavin kinase/FAD synthetase n=1 Tax=Paenibacillus sp. 1011MAR3C5 TaxID=1675787 RepID=UPI000E6BC4E2|nr:bifunctional riboflavin kinase/FAD synthetase [Paenibacillus sp. 1011MAR3C5]RJE86798.1 bifunctional riboflavin kinase/FAD synthetase [Paenibacillus sp. 1011MAR3C5]
MEIIPLSYPLSQAGDGFIGKQMAIAMGHFDGVHRGHQNVVRQAVAHARKSDMLSAVLTFSPHPKEVLGHGDQYYRCLTPIQSKMRLFEELGVDVVFVMKFDHTLAALTPGQFVADVLIPLGVKHAVVGFDFTFGNRGSGNAEMLRELGGTDFTIDIVEPLFENGKKVSSTYTRESLENGDLTMAHTLLGRPYEVVGTVVHGDGRGRTIGFPTANLELLAPYVSPSLGVYAITAWVDGKSYGGVLNHGMKPTFNKSEIVPVMEAHLFDFDQDIYGMEMTVQFQYFIRPEQKFGSVSELIAQIAADSDRARSLLTEL